jgi:hypothetical protein
MMPSRPFSRSHEPHRADFQSEEILFRHAMTIVCCWENSGKYLLAARISPFDPERKFWPSETRRMLYSSVLSAFWPAFAFALGETVFAARQRPAECAEAH